MDDIKEALIQTQRALDAQKDKRLTLNQQIETLTKQVRSLIHQLADDPVFVFEYGRDTYVCVNGTLARVLRI